jgi:hypothetical protein
MPLAASRFGCVRDSDVSAIRMCQRFGCVRDSDVFAIRMCSIHEAFYWTGQPNREAASGDTARPLSMIVTATSTHHVQ